MPGVRFVVAALQGAAPILALLDRVEPISSLDTSVFHVLDIALALLGSAILPVDLGLGLLVPSRIAIAGLDGVTNADYATRVGRFVPGVGRIGRSL